MCACAPITKIIFFFSQGRVVIYFEIFKKKSLLLLLHHLLLSSSSSFFYFNFFLLSCSMLLRVRCVLCHHHARIRRTLFVNKKVKGEKKESPMKKVKNQCKTGDMYVYKYSIVDQNFSWKHPKHYCPEMPGERFGRHFGRQSAVDGWVDVSRETAKINIEDNTHNTTDHGRSQCNFFCSWCLFQKRLS